MGKRTYAEIRNKVLQVLSDGETHSFGSLERKVNTNWQTIRMHCENLEFFGAATITDEGVQLSSDGKKLVETRL